MTNERGRAQTRAGLAVATIGVLALAIGAVAAQTSTSATRPAGTTQAIPRTPDGKPDFSGIWQALTTAEFDIEPHQARKDAPPGLGIVEGGTIPYTAAGLAQRQKNFEARATADPRLKCFTPGVPRGIYYPEPFQIFQRPRDVTIMFEFGHPVRTIHTNGTQHPDGHIDFWLGDSRGRWEGDTLVVDTVDFNGETWLDRAGNFASDGLHVVERLSFVDANTIAYRATLDDPNVFTRPWSLSVFLNRHREPNFQLIENYCYTLDYDDYYPLPKK